MTAILDDMRRLDDAHARGDISAIDLADAKAQLLEAVPDATEPAHAEPTLTPVDACLGFWPTLLLCALILTVCIGAALLLIGDITLSATLAITVLAAVTVMLFRQLDG